MKRASILATACGVVLMMAALGPVQNEDEPKVPFADCPAAVQKTLREATRGAVIATVVKETNEDVTTYRASVVVDGRKYALEVDEDGTLIDMSLEVDQDEVKFSSCPKAAQTTFRKESRDSLIDVVGKSLRLGGAVYDAVVTLSGKDYAIVVAEDGTLIEKTLLIDDEAIELSECPAAVQKTLREHAAGGQIGAVTRSTGIGGHVYDAEVEIHGLSYIVEVTEKGVLFAKSLNEVDEAAPE